VTGDTGVSQVWLGGTVATQLPARIAAALRQHTSSFADDARSSWPRFDANFANDRD
jgi:hypothetical protein